MKTLLLFLLFFESCLGITFTQAKQIEKEQGIKAAIPLYKKLAKNENTEAIYELAMLYAKGKVVRRNIKKTHELLEQGYILGHKKATYSFAKLMLNKKTSYFNDIKAYNILVDLSEDGFAPALNMLGKMLLKGIVVEKDYKLSVKYFERASKQNFIEAHCNLAYMYASGKGVFPNFGRAHSFAKVGMKKKHPFCKKVYKEYHLAKFPEDKGWKFNFYTTPKN